ncbi:MAG: hypothetical protein AB7I18_07120 [Candidatus Berkiella sp.]
MSESHNLISSFTHLIENSQHLSSQEIADHTLKMMQMLANNPSLFTHWRTLQDTLEALYNSLEDELTAEHLTWHVSSALKLTTA